MKSNTLCLVLLAGFTFSFCTTEQQSTESVNTREQLEALAQQDPNLLLEETAVNQKMVVYQIFTRLFGNTQKQNVKYGTIAENGVGKFNDINAAALQSLKEMGITHIWYTGVIEHAVLHDYREFGIVID
ncbi:MAG: alpha-amylase, partial [bacterium]